MIVGNHVMWAETFLAFQFEEPIPAFLAKQDVKQIPAVYEVIEANNGMFMQRSQNKSESRRELMESILERQKAAEAGKINPIIIFPEGCTTNGKYLIQFKKGPFASLRPVKPFVNKFKGLRCNPAMGDCLNVWHYAILIFQCVAITATQYEMPVFAPNDYFWKHHWDGKNPDDRWKVFAEAVRQIMAEYGGFELSDATVEDKLEYKNMIKKQKKGSKAD